MARSRIHRYAINQFDNHIGPHILHVLLSLTVLASGMLVGTETSIAALPQRPNIVFILAVDLGYTDLACYGSTFYESPNIDRLAASGVRFTDGYTCGPNCQPTRASLLSGQYGPRTVDFVQRHRDKPFFLYLPHFGVHGPHEAKEQLIARFRSKPAGGGHKDPTYAAMIASVDESVGRIVALSDELKLTEKTLVIFPGYLGSDGGTWRTKPGGAIRHGDWKLIEYFEDGRFELFNLKEDVGEKTNLAERHPDKVKSLSEKLVAWRKSTGALMPTPNRPDEDAAAPDRAKNKKKRRARQKDQE